MGISRLDRLSSRDWLGIVLIISGALILLLFPILFLHFLLKVFVLTPSSRTYQGWLNPTVELYQDVYLFNWTNPEELKDKTKKPAFTQLGPYRFREYRNIINVNFHESTVSFQKFSNFFFDPEGSNGTLSDLCTTVNMVAVGAGSRAEKWNFILQKGVAVALGTYKHKLHVVKTVGELLFEGYDDEMLTMSNIFGSDSLLEKVGLLVQKNGTKYLKDFFEINTGVNDIAKIGLIESYNNLTDFPYYKGECNILKESGNVDFFPPSNYKSIQMFAPEMCRSVPFDFDAEEEYRGIKGHRFVAGARALDNGTRYKENKCYAPENTDLPSGVMSISACNQGFPVLISFPHFLFADPIFVTEIVGLKPDRSKHEAFLMIEPTTGTSLEIAGRFQTNFLLKEFIEHVALFKDVPNVVIPVFWVEQIYRLHPEPAEELRMGLLVPFMVQCAACVVIAVGIIMLVMTKFGKKNLKDWKSEMPAEDENGNLVIINGRERKPLIFGKVPT